MKQGAAIKNAGNLGRWFLVAVASLLVFMALEFFFVALPLCVLVPKLLINLHKKFKPPSCTGYVVYD